MVAPSLHLNWFNPVNIRLSAGLVHSITPPQAFVVLADPAAISPELAQACRQRWGALCLHWCWQPHALSSLDAAQDLAHTLWPWLGSPDTALWAIGGGTTLDLAKLLRWRFADTASAAGHWRHNRLPDGTPRHALWCSPTTSGTGSEVTPWATVWDLQAEPACKRSWSPAQGFAEHAWIDPLLTLSCPDAVTRDTALDALSHALESLWNQRANRLSRPIAIEAARLILDTLPELLHQPQSVGLRTRMAKASLLAGLAMSQTQTALAHALSYELTLREHMPHGQACAVWLPMVMALAAQRSAQVRHDLEAVFRQPIAQCVRTLQAWLHSLGVHCRDLQDSAEGRHTLQDALGSDRGRNFIAEETT